MAVFSIIVAIFCLLHTMTAQLATHATTGKYTGIHDAAWRGDLGLITEMVEAGTPVDLQTSTGATPLYAAARNGKFEAMELLVKLGANVDKRETTFNGTALIQAAASGQDLAIITLLDLGTDITATNIYGNSALHMAAQEGYPRAVQVLLDQGSDIHARDNNGNSPLHDAAWAGQSKTVDVLLRAGASPFKLDRQGTTPLADAELRSKDNRDYNGTIRLLTAAMEQQTVISPTQLPTIACRVNEATCMNEECVPKNAVCDGRFDCTDGSDEMRCKMEIFGGDAGADGKRPDIGTLKPEARYLRYLLVPLRADNNSSKPSTLSEAACTCTHFIDCLELSNTTAQNCNSIEVCCKRIKPKTVAITGICSSNQFRCKGDGFCIPADWKCDDYGDCIDKSDEADCTTSPASDDRSSIASGPPCTLPSGSSGQCLPLDQCRGQYQQILAVLSTRQFLQSFGCTITSDDNLGVRVCCATS